MARLLLFGGKGGVGKTTTSCATAVWLADAGLKVLLVSSDPAHSTSDSLDVQLGTTPTEVDGVPGLFGLEMDPEAKLSNLLPKVGEAMNKMGSGGMGGMGGLGMMLDPTAKDELDDLKSDIKTADMILPGLDEALAFDELLKHMENPTWDVVVFDTAPTGHTLRFLSLPELIEAWSGRLLRLMRVSGGLRSMLFGRKESEAMKDELERFRRRVLHVRRVLSDPLTSSFTLVTIPERMGVNETLRAHESLVDYQLPIGGCLVNRITPEFDHPFLQQRREQELGRIAELEEALEGVNVGRLELADQEIVGVDALRLVGQLLYGEVKTIETTIGPHGIGHVLFHDVHRGMVTTMDDEFERIQLHFPGLERSDLSLRSEEGVLFVGVNGREQAIPTETHVKSSLVKASLEGDVLSLLVPRDSSP
ncbi:MAG: TRC40/GET3/ArsA family transport-energizing ATPase [Candidatus Poseidonia sp.]|nr:TRC40/GET3/ArsA family transport-energizing ATPase [Poseidonia sp.]